MRSGATRPARIGSANEEEADRRPFSGSLANAPAAVRCLANGRKQRDEGLVARGSDVTLYATGDSLTQASLRWTVEKGYEEDKRLNPKVAEYLHISKLFEEAEEFALIHNHFDFMPLT